MIKFYRILMLLLMGIIFYALVFTALFTGFPMEEFLGNVLRIIQIVIVCIVIIVILIGVRVIKLSEEKRAKIICNLRKYMV